MTVGPRDQRRGTSEAAGGDGEEGGVHDGEGGHGGRGGGEGTKSPSRHHLRVPTLIIIEGSR